MYASDMMRYIFQIFGEFSVGISTIYYGFVVSTLSFEDDPHSKALYILNNLIFGIMFFIFAVIIRSQQSEL